MRVDATETFIRTTRVVPLEHGASGLALDVVLAGPGLEDQFLDRAVPIDVAGTIVPFISPEDLIVTKLLAGREKDLDDVRGVLAERGAALDVDQIRTRCGCSKRRWARAICCRCSNASTPAGSGPTGRCAAVVTARLTHSDIGMYKGVVARASTTSDPFNAIAEPRRRHILEFLAAEEHSVGDIAEALELNQPSVSKHLRVLLDVGLVSARREGRHAMYRTNADGLRTVHEWSGMFARYWRGQLRRIKAHAEEQR